MEETPVRYKGYLYTCRRYTLADEPDILAIIPAWRKYATAVKRIDGKIPQVSSAFSQAFCCLRLGLVEKMGEGVDAFRIDAAGNVLAVEIKATATMAGRNDIRIYPKSVNGREQAINAPVDVEFDELYWLSFSDISMCRYEIYRILPEHIVGYVHTLKPEVRGGRVNIAFQRLVICTNMQPITSGDL